MCNKFGLWLLLFISLFSSCQSINRSRTELEIPERTVFFSFDDGPDVYGDTTARLLDVLKKHQIRALFCLLGENAEQYPDLVRRINDEGHIIVNHGYRGKWAGKMDDEEFRDNLVRGGEAISTALGFDMEPKLYRPHGGLFKSRHEKIWIDEGYAMVPATVRVYDAVATAADQRKIARKAIEKLEKREGGMLLLHDGRDTFPNRERQLKKNPEGAFNRSWIPETVDEIITVLLEKGFVLNGLYDPGLTSGSY